MCRLHGFWSGQVSRRVEELPTRCRFLRAARLSTLSRPPSVPTTHRAARSRMWHRTIFSPLGALWRSDQGAFPHRAASENDLTLKNVARGFAVRGNSRRTCCRTSRRAALSLLFETNRGWRHSDTSQTHSKAKQRQLLRRTSVTELSTTFLALSPSCYATVVSLSLSLHHLHLLASSLSAS